VRVSTTAHVLRRFTEKNIKKNHMPATAWNQVFLEKCGVNPLAAGGHERGSNLYECQFSQYAPKPSLFGCWKFADLFGI
jgi:hypothetical protein